MDPMRMQAQLRQNASELGDYLSDLNSWEKEAAAKDQALASGSLKLTKDKSVAKPASTATKPAASKPDASNTNNYAQQESPEFARAKEEGNQKFKAGDFPAALLAYSRCIHAEPQNAVGHSNRAMAFLKLGNHAEAERDCTQALSLDRDNVKVLFRRAQSRRGLGDLRGAAGDLAQAQKLEPQNAAVAKELHEVRVAIFAANGAKPSSAEPASRAAATTAAAPAAASSSGPRRTKIIVQEVDSDGESDDDTLVPVEATKAPLAAKTASPSPPPPQASAAPSAPAAPQARAATGAAPASSPSSKTSVRSAPAATSAPAPAPPAARVATLAPPTSTFEFEVAYRELRQAPEQLARYLKIIKPETIPTLLRAALDGDVLHDILHALCLFSDADLPIAAALLKSLAQVERYDMLTMMMDDADSASLETLHSRISRGNKN